MFGGLVVDCVHRERITNVLFPFLLQILNLCAIALVSKLYTFTLLTCFLFSFPSCWSNIVMLLLFVVLVWFDRESGESGLNDAHFSVHLPSEFPKQCFAFIMDTVFVSMASIEARGSSLAIEYWMDSPATVLRLVICLSTLVSDPGWKMFPLLERKFLNVPGSMEILIVSNVDAREGILIIMIETIIITFWSPFKLVWFFESSFSLRFCLPWKRRRVLCGILDAVLWPLLLSSFSSSSLARARVRKMRGFLNRFSLLGFQVFPPARVLFNKPWDLALRWPLLSVSGFLPTSFLEYMSVYEFEITLYYHLARLDWTQPSVKCNGQREHDDANNKLTIGPWGQARENPP